VEEFVQLGLDEMLYGSGVSLIEWPERAGDELPRARMTLRVQVLDGETRRIVGPEWLLRSEDDGR
jgi:tRNA threonylcarbamoyladenosine biosynthesis protein TsaE